MALLATDLAYDSMKEITAMFTAVAAATTATSSALEPPTATSAARVWPGEVTTTSTAALHSNIRRGVGAAISDLAKLFMTHQLSLQFLEGDRFNSILHSCRNRVKLFTQPHENIGDELIIIHLLAR